jgi:hypothetical protein
MALPWHVSVSILLAGALVAVAVYLRPSASPEPTERFPTSPMAERDRRRGWDDEPAPEPARPVVGGAELANSEVSPLGVPSTPQERTELQKNAGEAFERIRNRVRSDCWDKLPDDPEAPDELNLTLRLSYDADGKVLMSGIHDPPEGYSVDLDDCLGPLIHGLDVPAPGSNGSVELHVTIP